MIDALIQGRIHGQPTQRNGKNGKPFALAKVRAPTTDGESQFVSVIAFDDAPVTALLGLGDGDAVAVAGTLKVGTWQDREGAHRPSLDLVAHQVLSLYAVRHKRTASQGEAPAAPRPAPTRPQHDHGGMDGEIPF
ncbi:single-stranded DNA-binding protein [Giesbergeria anulus]|uniref:Single-strand binding protein family protein n=1 Tax=Giesbergeria anulus TaxID=180197 RepID=A0A1H9RVQ8_9BURK|nr:single-stranded DNA-binding protein [Giesbergeria anulus]SER76688.1 Single-strand binding protein family protein [Giesbergeria anulus]